jgi:hypothetical protein
MLRVLEEGRGLAGEGLGSQYCGQLLRGTLQRTKRGIFIHINNKARKILAVSLSKTNIYLYF